MNLSELVEVLQEIKKQGHGGRKIAVDKTSFADGNKTFNICDIELVSIEFVHKCDGDGSLETTKGGKLRGETMIVIKGGLD